jgi:hypothetical protein
VLYLVESGGKWTFAASAKSKGQREESGRSGHQPVFFCCANAANGGSEPLLTDGVTSIKGGFNEMRQSGAIVIGSLGQPC